MNKLNSKKESKLDLAKKAIYVEREVLQEKVVGKISCMLHMVDLIPLLSKQMDQLFIELVILKIIR